MREVINLVWFKRDLRICDHVPLALASQDCLAGIPVLGLYVIEHDYWKSEKASANQYAFVRECLLELSQKLGEVFLLRRGHVVSALSELSHFYKINKIFAHMETSNRWTFDRDLAVQRWCRENQIALVEVPQQGVIRGKKGTLDKEALRERFSNWLEIKANEAPKHWVAPRLRPKSIPLPTVEEVCGTSAWQQRQPGGESQAHALLKSFVTSRVRQGKGYQRAISSPNDADEGCSRLSPHFTWGSMSTRFTYQTILNKCGRNRDTNSFLRRLGWRAYFTQKFETLHGMEFHFLNPKLEKAFRGSDAAYQRWKAGTTGYPMIDACMRYLNVRGWINFRMRAMLVSFASFALRLDWRQLGLHLAGTFLDYEPGIHYCQLQMQSGTTLNNIPRIYNPVKQSQDHDPTGQFIRQWVPELAAVPLYGLHEPWKMPKGTYCPPIVPPQGLWLRMQRDYTAALQPKKVRSQEADQLTLGI